MVLTDTFKKVGPGAKIENHQLKGFLGAMVPESTGGPSNFRIYSHNPGNQYGLNGSLNKPIIHQWALTNLINHNEVEGGRTRQK